MHKWLKGNGWVAEPGENRVRAPVAVAGCVGGFHPACFLLRVCGPVVEPLWAWRGAAFFLIALVVFDGSALAQETSRFSDVCRGIGQISRPDWSTMGNRTVLASSKTLTKQTVREAVWLGADVGLLSHTAWFGYARGERLNVLPLGATAMNQFDEVDLLLRRGADPNVDASFDDFMTPLITAVRCSSPKVTERLLRAGAKVNLPVLYPSDYRHIVENSTALIWAAERGDPDIVRILLAAGADPNAQESFAGEQGLGSTPLIASRSAIVSRLLLAAGARPNTSNRLGRTPLMMAEEHGDTEACRILLQFGAIRSARDADCLKDAN